MAVVITIADVRADYETSLSDDAVQMSIDFVDGADACLDANNVPDAQQKVLKIYGARHQLWVQSNQVGGTLKSRTDQFGSSQSFSGYTGKNGSPYGDLLEQQDRHGCVWSMFSNSQPGIYFAAVGGSS